MKVKLTYDNEISINVLVREINIERERVYSLIDYVYTNYPEYDQNTIVDAVGFVLRNFTQEPEKAKKFLDVYLKLLEYETTYWDLDYIKELDSYVEYDAKYYMQKLYNRLKKHGLDLYEMVFLVNTAERFYKYFNPLISINYRPGNSFFEFYNYNEVFYREVKNLESIRYLNFIAMVKNTLNLYENHNFDKEKTIESLSTAAKAYLSLSVRYKTDYEAEKVFEYVLKGYDDYKKIAKELKQELDQELKRKEVNYTRNVEPSL